MCCIDRLKSQPKADIGSALYLSMKLTVISDTHNQHEQFGILSGEVLIHCGDMFNLFSKKDGELESIDDWFGRQKFDLILCTGGNHDSALEEQLNVVDEPFQNAVYLQDRAYIHDGINFYGAPWTPELAGQAFYREGSELERVWQSIPANVDVLITHTPPAGILDVSSRGLELGCQYLAKQLRVVNPRVNCFGNVHASSGTQITESTTYINASSVNSQFELTRRPYEVEIRD